MKRLLTVGLVTLSATSFAATRDIYDLMYLPEMGTTFGLTDLNGVRASSDIADVNGYNINQTLGKTLTENFSLAVSLNYSDLNIEPSEEKDARRSGISDPTFLGRYRLTDDAFRWDLLASTTLGPGISETDSDGDQNNYSGRVSANLGTQFGQKRADFQWAINALYTRNLKATHKNDGETSSEEAFNAFSVDASILKQLAERSFVRAAFGASHSERHEGDDDTKYLQSTTTFIQAEYRHLCAKDLLVKFGATFSATTFSGSNDQADSTLINVGAVYQF